MSKTCPSCGINSPDNAKFCIECAYDIEEVPINEKENKTSESTGDEGSNTENSGEKSGLSCIIIIAIVGAFVLTNNGNGGKLNTQITDYQNQISSLDSQITTANAKIKESTFPLSINFWI